MSDTTIPVSGQCAGCGETNHATIQAPTVPPGGSAVATANATCGNCKALVALSGVAR